MQRRLIAIALAAASGTVHGQPAPPAPDPGSPAPAPEPGSGPPAPAPVPDPSSTARAPVPGLPGAATPPASAAPSSVPSEPSETDDDVGDQAIWAELGLATGGRVTPGGLRLAGHYLYQLAEHDWFDGTASFTFGSGAAACFRDRQDAVVCNHGLADGAGVEISGAIRRLFAPQGAFRPFVRVGAGLGVARFAGDDVSGLTVALHGGGGIRVTVAPAIAVIAAADLELGFGVFGRGLGSQPQLGLAITAGAEFRLR